MSDKDDPNLTIGPGEAREGKKPSILHAATQRYVAIKDEQVQKRADNPKSEMMKGYLYKIVGIGLIWWARGEWPSAAKTGQALQVGVVIGGAVVGLYLLAPTQILTLISSIGGYLPWRKDQPLPQAPRPSNGG